MAPHAGANRRGLLLDVARGASTAQITAVPHFADARPDKKDASRISIDGWLGRAPAQDWPELTVRSVAGLLAEAIRRIHDGESVSSLFDGVDPAHASPRSR